MKYFETEVSYFSTQEDGTQKKQREAYLVDALSFTEAEKRTTDFVTDNITPEFEVTKEKRSTISEIIDEENTGEDAYFRIKVFFLEMQDNGKEKKIPNIVLVRASNPENAIQTLNEAYKNSMLDFIVDTVSTTNIVSVIKTPVK